MFFTRAPRLTRPRLIILAGVLAVAGLLLASIQAGSAHAATTRTADATAQSGASGPKPAIVLVHGAWADSGSWNAVTRILQADGYTVYAPPNPLQGLPYDTGTISSFLHSVSGPIVLVGHSYGGAVITNAAAGNSQVKALVYDDAYLPAKGDSLLTLTTGGCFAVSDPSTVFNFVPFPGAAPGVSDAYVKPGVFPAASRTACPQVKARCWPPPSGPWPPARSPTSPGRRPGPRSRPGPSSAPATTPSPRPTSCSWPTGRTRTSPRSTHRTCP